MRKLVIISCLLILSITSTNIYGQEFLGIKVDGKLYDVIAKFKLKGFKITSKDELNPILEGRAGTTDVELIIFSSPKSKTVFKFSVYLPKKNDWDAIKSE
jgi:hypothetical protein